MAMSFPSMVYILVAAAAVACVNAGMPWEADANTCGNSSCSLVLLQQHAEKKESAQHRGGRKSSLALKHKQMPQHLMVSRKVQTAGIEAAEKVPGEVATSLGEEDEDAVWTKGAPAGSNGGGESTGVVQPQTSMMVAYVAALVFMVACVTAMFYPMGVTVCFQVVLYVCCLAFVKIAMKLVYDCGFNYPKFITSLHLGISSLAAFTVLLHKYITAGKPIAIPTTTELFTGILPVALTFGLSIGAENSALVFVSAAFSEVVAASNPVMSAFLTWALGMDFHTRLVLPIMLVVLGCVVSVSGEVYFSAFGLALLLLSVFCRGLKAVMQQKLMTGETKERFDPVTLMAWTCLFSFIEVFIYSLASEGLAPMTTLLSNHNLPRLLVALIGSCIIACTLNISALFVIKQLGAVGMQMVSQMKSLLVVVGGMLLLAEPFTNTQKVGFVTVLSGVYWYSQMKRTMAAPPAKGGK